MFLKIKTALTRPHGFPRVCGDVSPILSATGGSGTLSPRMRGCFRNIRAPSIISGAFPAYAGMFPVSGDTPMHVRGFPRVCGDVSLAKTVLDALNRLSPRMRGCFQCLNAPTAYRSSFPRVCGDVSPVQQTSSTDDTLSPRMRGCF